MRISRGRLLLRVALLLVGGGFMVWRALETRSAALTQAGADWVLGERLALVMALVGLLALLTAAWWPGSRGAGSGATACTWAARTPARGRQRPGTGDSSQRWSLSCSRSADLRNLPVALRGMASM